MREIINRVRPSLLLANNVLLHFESAPLSSEDIIAQKIPDFVTRGQFNDLVINSCEEIARLAYLSGGCDMFPYIDHWTVVDFSEKPVSFFPRVITSAAAMLLSIEFSPKKVEVILKRGHLPISEHLQLVDTGYVAERFTRIDGVLILQSLIATISDNYFPY